MRRTACSTCARSLIRHSDFSIDEEETSRMPMSGSSCSKRLVSAFAIASSIAGRCSAGASSSSCAGELYVVRDFAWSGTQITP